MKFAKRNNWVINHNMYYFPRDKHASVLTCGFLRVRALFHFVCKLFGRSLFVVWRYENVVPAEEEAYVVT